MAKSGSCRMCRGRVKSLPWPDYFAGGCKMDSLYDGTYPHQKCLSYDGHAEIQIGECARSQGQAERDENFMVFVILSRLNLSRSRRH